MDKSKQDNVNHTNPEEEPLLTPSDQVEKNVEAQMVDPAALAPEVQPPLLNREFGRGVLDFPEDIFFYQGKAYVGDSATDTVHVFNEETGTHLGSEDIPTAFGGAPNSAFLISKIANGILYAHEPAAGNDFVTAYDVATRARQSRKEFGQGVLSRIDGIELFNGKAYISDRDENIIRTFDLTNGSHLSGEDLGDGVLQSPGRMHRVDNTLYVLNRNRNISTWITVIDIPSKVVLRTIPLEGILNVDLTILDEKIFVVQNVSESTGIRVYDLTTGERIPGNDIIDGIEYPRAIEYYNGNFYITDREVVNRSAQGVIKVFQNDPTVAPEVCNPYIAIVVDDSGSISGNVQEIRDGLQAFVDDQVNDGLTLSLIRMNFNDTTIRTDNLTDLLLTTGSKPAFDSWIAGYNPSGDKDWWLSGLRAIPQLQANPDLVVVIADGSDTNDLIGLQESVAAINSTSHLFVYAVDTMFYDNGTSYGNIQTALTSYLQRSPIETGLVSDILTADYLVVPDFQALGSALAEMSQVLRDNQVGCGGSPFTSTITAKPTSLDADGSSTSTITVVARDNFGNPINTGGDQVEILTDLGSISATTDRGNGTYTAMLTATDSEGTAILSFTMRGTPGNNTTTVLFEQVGDRIDLGATTSLQSPSFLLQTAGSMGNDGSAEGIHIRWNFAGVLGNRHLPKGNYATTSHNFNKPNDFVRLYRALYGEAFFITTALNPPVKTTIDLNEPPTRVYDSSKLWTYMTNGKKLYVYFRNAQKYDQVRATIDPAANPGRFVENYGAELIEVQSKENYFFAATLNVEDISSGDTLRTEAHSSIASLGPTSLAPNFFNKKLSHRRTYSGPALYNVKILVENGRSVRFEANGCNVYRIDLEFYEDFILSVNGAGGWEIVGDYALTLDDAEARTRLEPTAGTVHGQWPHFNDGSKVNTQNYLDRWNGPLEGNERNLRSTIENYIALSDSLDNPRAIEFIPLEDSETIDEATETLEISNLDMLTLASYDFHMARMMGLGTLDLSPAARGQTFVYLAKYVTLGDLEDGNGEREVQHLSMSLPTFRNDERLPLPVDLKELVPGLFVELESGEPKNLMDDQGYASDCKRRNVTLYAEDLPQDVFNAPFYDTNDEFSLSEFSYPVYAGLEYRVVQSGQTDDGVWQKPEISVNPDYTVIDPGVEEGERLAPLPIPLPDGNLPLFVHQQQISGTHYYSSYGINLFSRATSSGVVRQVDTDLTPKNTLQPPSNVNPLLVREEGPLLLSSSDEQSKLSWLQANESDDTLVRLTFNYHHIQDMVRYNIPDDTPYSKGDIVSDPDSIFPDSDEVFADTLEIFFRDEVPSNVGGQMVSVEDDPVNQLLAIVSTRSYVLPSSGDTMDPSQIYGKEDNYVGGVFVVGDQKFIVHQVSSGAEGPVFRVFKKEVSDALVGDIPSPDADDLLSPKVIGDGLFTVIENMQNTVSWGTPNPFSFEVSVGNNWPIHRELVKETNDEGVATRDLEKTRGIWGGTSIEEQQEPNADGTAMEHRGLYKVTFDNHFLDQHPQYTEYDLNDDGIVDNVDISVEWYRGVVRVPVYVSDPAAEPNRPRRTLQVIRMENVVNPGDTTPPQGLVLYAYDATFSDDPEYVKVQTGSSIEVNYYPGYKVYLLADAAHGLTKEGLQPEEGQGVRYAIFGLRSRDTGKDYHSKIGVPSPMAVQEIVPALPPEQPTGANYATRPDFFGRSTYTLITEYKHKPHAVLFYRSNDEALLHALYGPDTIMEIRNELAQLGGKDETYFANRWENFLDFETLGIEGDYRIFPPADVEENGYKLPNPDKQALFDWANSILEELEAPIITDPPGSLPVGDPKLIDFVRGAIYSAFVPLTEAPIIYNYLQGNDYTPVNRKQTIRDKDGYLLTPGQEGFEMAPMMKVAETSPHTTLFTDFNLDGTTDNFYFYGVRELSSQMKMGDFGPFLGPVKLPNTNPPEAPEIRRVMPVLRNDALGIAPHIQIEVNPYSQNQNIGKIQLYRSFDALSARSIRTMEPIRTVDLEAEDLLSEAIWKLKDDFRDLEEVPYGDALYYRCVAMRKVQYANKKGNVINEYAPSHPSKTNATLMVEASNPPSPELRYTSDPPNAQGELNNITLLWDKTCYRGIYHLYKINAEGNWAKIHEVRSDQDSFRIDLEDTDLGTSDLLIRDTEGNKRYHHFKVIAENTSGMLSVEERILTLFDDANYTDIDGIGEMEIDSTFVVRPSNYQLGIGWLRIECNFEIESDN